MIIGIYTGSLLSVLLIIPMDTGHLEAVIFTPIFITFTFTPLPTSGQDHLSLSLSSPISRVESLSSEAVVFVTLLPQQDHVRSVIVTFITFTFTPLPTSGQDHLSLSFLSPISHVEFIFILRLSHSSPYHQLQDYVHSVIVTFITFTFTPLPTSGQGHLSRSLSSPIGHVGSIVILRLLHSSPYHRQQDYVHSVIVTFITFSFTPFQHRDRIICRCHFVTYQPRRVYCHPEAVAFVTISPTTGLCSFRNCHIHHIPIHPITNIGSGSFVAVTFVTYQPRRVYCHPEAVAFVTLLPTSGHVHSVIITFVTFTFTPLPTSGQDHLSLSLSSPSATSGLLSC